MNLKIPFLRLARPVCLAAFFCLLSLGLAGQVPGNPEASSGDIRLRVISTSEIKEPLYYMDGGQARALISGFRFLPEPIRLTRSASLTVGRQRKTEAGVVFEPLATLPIGEGIRDGLVALIPPPGTGRGGSYTLKLFDHSLKAHPIGSARFVNVSPRELAVQIDTETLRVAPFASVVKDLEDGQSHINMKVGIIVQDRGRVLDRSRLQYVEGTRMLYVGFPEIREQYGRAFTVIRHRDQGP